MRQSILFLTVLEAGSPRPRCQQGWFLMKPLFLACKWPDFFLCLHKVFDLLFFKDTSHIRLEPILKASFELNYFFKDFISKYNIIPSYPKGISSGTPYRMLMCHI